MGMVALLDGDVVVYQAGFGSDAAAKARGYDHEPIEYQLHAVKETINSILDAAGAEEYLVLLSHPVNRREEIFPDYKANRDSSHKPYWYYDIKEYLLEHHGAQYSEEGDEADDALGILQMEALAKDQETIICTNDKDLDMIPGLHYNFSKTKRDNGVYEMDDPECLRKFYTQMLTGDSTDNIPGLYRKTGIKASPQHKLPLEGFTTDREMRSYIRDVYKDDDFVQLIGQLLWIKRERGERGWWQLKR